MLTRTGLALKTDGLAAQHILAGWKKVVDFQDAEHPHQPADLMGLLENSGKLPDNKPVSSESLGIKGKVALVTGGGAGLGRAYAMELAM